MSKRKHSEIPRCMHQIWLQGENHLRETQPRIYNFMCHARKKCLAAKWTHKLWCEDDALELLNKKIRRIYDSAPSYAARADILRYAILFAHGGLYLDMDVLILEPYFDWIFKDLGPKEEVVVEHAYHHNPTEQAIYGQTNNAFIACRRRSVMIRRMLCHIKNSPPFASWWGKNFSKSLRALIWTLRVTGPKAFESVMYSSPRRIRFLPTGLVGCHTMLTQRIKNTTNANDLTDLSLKVKQTYPSLLFYHFREGSWTNPSVSNAAFSLRHFLARYAIFIIIVFVVGIIFLTRAKLR